MVTIKETDDYYGLFSMFKEHGLEVSPENPPYKETIKYWEALDESGKRLGGAELEKRVGEYVIGGISVLPEYRNNQIGKAMMERVIDEVRALGGDRLMLVAKVPEFYNKLGFVSVPRENAPDISKCITCPQFNNSCFPEVMLLKL